MTWLAWLAVIVLVIAALAVKAGRGGVIVFRGGTPGRTDSAKRAQQPETPERMLACERCGLHVPESEAVHRYGSAFCCHDHSLWHFPG